MDWRLWRGWRMADTQLLPALRPLIEYREDRATGWLWLPGQPPHTDWPQPFTELGPNLLAELQGLLDMQVSAVAFQAYRDGTGCGWHHDRDWGAQAILSLGVTRTFGLRNASGEEFLSLGHGDLLYMPPGFQDSWEHCVPEEDVPGERCSLVFRATR